MNHGLLTTPFTSSNGSSSRLRPVNEDARKMISAFEKGTREMGKFPAKNVINHLTKLAQDKIHASKIVQFLQDKITKVSPECKLPLFYLMDSIMKNVGGKYVEYFGKSIVELYSNCIDKVNTKDQARFGHVLNTWEQSRVFSAQQIRSMRKAKDKVYEKRKQKPLPNEEDNVLRQLLTKLQIEMDVHPSKHYSLEEVRKNHPDYYQELLNYRDNNLSGDPRPESRSTEPLLPPPQSSVPVPVTIARDPRRRVPSPDPTAFNALDDEIKMTRLLALAKGTMAKSVITPPSPPTTQLPPTKMPDASTIMALLLKAQQLSPEITPVKEVVDFSTLVIKSEKERNEKNIQSLYAELPLVCRESGLRFKDQCELDAHLDFIFRYNQSQTEKARGGTSRSWYCTVHSWTTDFESLGSSSRGEENTSSSFFAQENKNNIDNLERIEETKIKADEGLHTCRICGDGFERFWDEEEEDWMFRNAVLSSIDNNETVGKTIFHQHCYSAATSNNSKSLTSSLLVPFLPNSPLRIVSPSTTVDEVHEEDEPNTPENSTNKKRPAEDPISEEDEDADSKRQRT